MNPAIIGWVLKTINKDCKTREKWKFPCLTTIKSTNFAWLESGIAQFHTDFLCWVWHIDARGRLLPKKRNMGIPFFWNDLEGSWRDHQCQPVHLAFLQYGIRLLIAFFGSCPVETMDVATWIVEVRMEIVPHNHATGFIEGTRRLQRYGRRKSKFYKENEYNLNIKQNLRSETLQIIIGQFLL